MSLSSLLLCLFGVWSQLFFTIRDLLLSIAWWTMPLEWIKNNNDYFMFDLNQSEDKAIELLSELKSNQKEYLSLTAVSSDKEIKC